MRKDKLVTAITRVGRARLLPSPHFWAIFALFGIGALLQYPQQFLMTESSSAFSFLGLTRHAAERVLLLLPIGYTVFVFGTRAGLVSIAVATAIMGPRVFLISDYLPDALFETAGVIIIGALGTLAFHSYRAERTHRRLALLKLDAAYRQLQDRNQRLEEHEKRLSNINRISGIVSQSLELKQILDNAVESIIHFTRADGAWIYLLNKEEGELVLSAHRGIADKHIRIKEGLDTDGKVAETGRPVVIEKGTVDFPTSNEPGERIHSIVVPLRSGDRVNGTLGLNSTISRSLKQEDVDLLSSIGEEIGIAIDNACLYKKQQEIAHALRKSEQRYRQLFENASDAIWVHDLEGNFLAVNKATEEMTGCGATELLNMNVRSFLTQESLNLAGQIRNMLLHGDKKDQPYEQHIIRKDGSEAILRLTTNLLIEEGKPHSFLHVARDVTVEKQMQEKLSNAYEELTESHQRLKQSQEQLIQAEKLTSLGQLAASIAHEVNNPLSGVLAYNQLLIRQFKSGTMHKVTALEYLARMETELVRSSKLIRSLLDFARQSPPAFRPVNLNEVVDRAYDLVAHSAQLQHIKVVKELNPSLPNVTADFDQLQQVCTNLILNAIQAMPEGGTLVLRTLVADERLTVEVGDTGSGISPENVRKLFTPFFTTKRDVKGVGLGLAVSYGIVQRHRGTIDVQSEVGLGTIFRVHLPRSRGESTGENRAETGQGKQPELSEPFAARRNGETRNETNSDSGR